MQFWLGIDIGSVSLKTALMDAESAVLFSAYLPTAGKPREAAIQALQRLRQQAGPIAFSGVCLTGSGKARHADSLGVPSVNEIVAHARGSWEQFPDVKSIIEIGGQDSKFITIARREDGSPYIERHAFNGLCSAGTGAFLDHQAHRLGLSIEDFSGQAYHAATVPPIAGRCSVFAKSDMIHLQQKGVGTDAIAAGLCHALARNYIATLCKGVRPAMPICFQGGVAANQGMRRAFAAVLGITEDDIRIPEHYTILGAIGAALFAREQPLAEPLKIDAILHILTQDAPLVGEASRPRLKAPMRPPAPGKTAPQAERAYLGLDVGSVTTKAVVFSPEEGLVASARTATRSRPIEASIEVLHILERNLKPGVRIAGFYATGSGRYLVRDLFGADGCIDEITAQARSAAALDGEADTIIEIGGQDSKFIRLKNGAVHDFVMNRMCAAGTGSFLAEQAERLDVAIEDEFARLALQAAAPVNLGTRCTVFMDSDLVHHIQLGKGRDDLCAGLAYSIAQNYLDMVVKSRQIGAHVIFQGGVANNTAVQAAFEALLKREITVHPDPSLSGAIGAALIAAQEIPDGPSRFIGFDRLDQPYTVQSFVCPECENACEIKQVHTERGCSSFGSICGRYEHDTAPSAGASLFTLRYRWLTDDYPTRKTARSRGDIGLPLGLSLHEQLPFWKTFFTALGFNPVISGRTTRAIAEQGAQKLPVETCMPIKVFYGHALHLAEQGYPLFIPHTPKQMADGENQACFLCPYTQAIGYIVRSKVSPQTIILEYPDSSDDEGWIFAAARTLGIPRAEVTDALGQARDAMHAFKRRCRDEGQRLLSQIDSSGQKAVVLIGRPYTSGDRLVNMDLPRQLTRLGAQAIPMDFLPLEDVPVPVFFEDLHWYMGRQALKAAEVVRAHPRLSAIVLTNFGCGPDAFIGQYLESILEHTPHLVLEFDEHRADTGMITRVEAYLRTLANPTAFSRTDVYKHKKPVRKDRSLREYRFFIQRFSDHAYAYAGSLRAAGCRAEVLPETDDTSTQLGKRHAQGNECHPYHSVLGDLLRLVTQPGFNPDGVAYYTPQYDGPCLLNQYGTAIRTVLGRLDIEGVALLNIGNMAVMDEIFPIYPLYLARSSYAIDRLFKWATEIRPYEKVPGEVQRVHRANMEMLLKRMGERRLDAGIREAVKHMQAIALESRRDRPVIGIAGDIYTRLNAHANFGLYDKLIANGFEVWPSALVMDVVLLGYEQRVRDLLDKGQKMKGLIAHGYIAAAAILRRSVDRYFPSDIRTPQESGFPRLEQRLSPYISHRVDKFISLNINRIGEFHEAGAHGVLNVMCPGCMVGTVSEAFFPELRERYDDLPLESLSYGDQQATHIDNRIEAFLHLVRESQAQRKR